MRDVLPIGDPRFRNRMLRSPTPGFTLIELLVTLAVLAVLATTVLPTAQLAIQRNREQEFRRALREIRRGIDAYKVAGDAGHIPREAGSSGYPKSLTALVEGIPDQTDPNHSKMYFLRRLPRDPMNADSSIPEAESWGKRSYESDADDPKEGDDIYDVYSLSKKTGLNGIPYAKW